MLFDTTTLWRCGAQEPSWVSSGQHVECRPCSWWGSSTPNSSWSVSLSSLSSPWRLSASSMSTCSCWHASMPGKLLLCPPAAGGSVGVNGGGAAAWEGPWLSPSYLEHLWCVGRRFSCISSSSWCVLWTRTVSVTDHCSSFMWCCWWATPSSTRPSTPSAALSSDTPSGRCCFVQTGSGTHSAIWTALYSLGCTYLNPGVNSIKICNATEQLWVVKGIHFFSCIAIWSQLHQGYHHQ